MVIGVRSDGAAWGSSAADLRLVHAVPGADLNGDVAVHRASLDTSSGAHGRGAPLLADPAARRVALEARVPEGIVPTVTNMVIGDEAILIAETAVLIEERATRIANIGIRTGNTTPPEIPTADPADHRAFAVPGHADRVPSGEGTPIGDLVVRQDSVVPGRVVLGQVARGRAVLRQARVDLGGIRIAAILGGFVADASGPEASPDRDDDRRGDRSDRDGSDDDKAARGRSNSERTMRGRPSFGPGRSRGGPPSFRGRDRDDDRTDRKDHDDSDRGELDSERRRSMSRFGPPGFGWGPRRPGFGGGFDRGGFGSRPPGFRPPPRESSDPDDSQSRSRSRPPSDSSNSSRTSDDSVASIEEA